MTSFIDTTPQQRLAASRKAIVRHMQRDKEPDERHSHSSGPARAAGQSGGFQALPDESYADGHSGQDSHAAGAYWAVVKHAISSWWYHHPASVALDVAKPLVGSFARKHPYKLLGIAAGAGAVAVMAKPWRLVSLGGLAWAALKSSDVSGLVLSALSGSGQSQASGETKNRKNP